MNTEVYEKSFFEKKIVIKNEIIYYFENRQLEEAILVTEFDKGVIERKYEDKTFLENNKTVYVYTEKGKLEYEILGVDLVDPDTSLYELTSKRNEDVEAMKKELTKHISKSEVDKIDKNSKILMLVTCKTPDDNTARRILFAKLKEK